MTDHKPRCSAFARMSCKALCCLYCGTPMPEAYEIKTACAWCYKCTDAEAKENGLSVQRMLQIRANRILQAKCITPLYCAYVQIRTSDR